MDALSEAQRLAADIRNAAYMVRHYGRAVQRAQRNAAIVFMGHRVRDAFANAQDTEYETLLAAIVDGLSPADYKPPF